MKSSRNQQISSRVLNGISMFQFIVVSSEQKLTTIDKLEIDRIESDFRCPTGRFGAWRSVKILKKQGENIPKILTKMSLGCDTICHA